MAAPSRLNLVCIDNSEFSHNGFEWYVHNHHRSNDVIGLAHVHEMPSLPPVSNLGAPPGLADVYQSQLENSYQVSKGNFIINIERCPEARRFDKVLNMALKFSENNFIKFFVIFLGSFRGGNFLLFKL